MVSHGSPSTSNAFVVVCDKLSIPPGPLKGVTITLISERTNRNCKRVWSGRGEFDSTRSGRKELELNLFFCEQENESWGYNTRIRDNS